MTNQREPQPIPEGVTRAPNGDLHTTLGRDRTGDSRVSGLLRAAIQERGLTLKETAELSGIGATALSRMQASSYHGHSTRTVRTLARALGYELHVNFVPRNTTEDGARP